MRPSLLCLNLQRDYLDVGSPLFIPRGGEAALKARMCLWWARRQQLSIVHIHTVSASRSGSIAGCEPLLGETLLFKTSASVFDSDEFSERYRGRAAFDAIVVGFAGSRDCLCAAIDAGRRQARLVFVSDAIASPALGAHDQTEVDAVLGSLLGELSASTSTLELMQREWRSERRLEDHVTQYRGGM